MTNLVFTSVLTLFFVSFFWWGFNNLPGERWQIMAAVPAARAESSHWRGVNLTYYGFFTANAYLLAVFLLFVMMAAIRVPVQETIAMTGMMLGLCVPASRLLAKLVEKKSYTFTVAGASFVGLLVAPWGVGILNRMPGGFPGSFMDSQIPVVPALAALAISYAFGEGMGRMACISFGCCYGKALSQSHPLLQRIFRRWSFTFSGRTKKISYASKLDEARVIPVQAITSIVCTFAGLIGLLLFLNSRFLTAFVLVVTVTQAWRIISETLRADYRGEGRVSAYQIMGLLSIFYSVLVSLLSPETPHVVPKVMQGLEALWNPGLLIGLQILWLIIFVYTGRSKVTGSTLSFHVLEDKI